jgi:predicted RNase H-like nuclease (RuvC/YqgF family)
LDNAHNRELFKTRQKVKSQKNQIRSLKKKNEDIEKKLEKSEREILRLKNKIYEMKNEYDKGILGKREIKAKIDLIKVINEKYHQERKQRMELEEKLEAIQEFSSFGLSKKVPVKIIEYFTKEGLKEACEYWKIQKGDVVFLKNSKGGGSHTAALISHRGVRAVLIQDKMSHQAREVFEKNMIPLLKVGNNDLKIIDRFAVIKPEVLERKIEEWNIQVKNKLDSEDRKKLLNIIDEYRAKRRRTTNSN